MNCSDLRPFLDQLTRLPGSASVDLLAAREHLATCLSCQRSLRSLAQWDQQLSQAMNDVCVPSGLSSRLISLVTETNPNDSVIKPTTEQPRIRTRWSRTLKPVLIASLLLLVVSGAWHILTPPMLSPIHVASMLQKPIDELSTVENSVRLLPRHWSTLKVATGDAKKLYLREQRLSVVVFPLDVRSGRMTVAGSLFVVPKSRWNATMSSVISKVPVSEAVVQYAPDYVWISWAEADSVYILALKGELTVLERLRNRLGGQQAFL